MIEEAPVDCLSCGQAFTLSIDTTGGREQSYVEDCPVCCRPMEITVECRDLVPLLPQPTLDQRVGYIAVWKGAGCTRLSANLRYMSR